MPVAAHVQSFVDDLYKRSDVGPEAHQAYVDLYLPDATLIMGPTEYKGHEGIMKFRETGWEKVSKRKHVCNGVFPSADKPESECMTWGTVDYGFKDGSTKEGIQFATRLQLAQDSKGEWKIKFYQVYIVSELVVSLMGRPRLRSRQKQSRMMNYATSLKFRRYLAHDLPNKPQLQRS